MSLYFGLFTAICIEQALTVVQICQAERRHTFCLCQALSIALERRSSCEILAQQRFSRSCSSLGSSYLKRAGSATLDSCFLHFLFCAFFVVVALAVLRDFFVQSIVVAVWLKRRGRRTTRVYDLFLSLVWCTTSIAGCRDLRRPNGVSGSSCHKRTNC